MAAGSIGAANAIVNWRMAGDEIDYVVNDSGAKILFVGAELMPAIEAIRDRLPNVEKIIAVTPDGAEGDEYEAFLAASAGLRRRPGRGRGRRLPDPLLLGHHRAPQGRDAHAPQHGQHTVNAHDGWEFLPGRQVDGGDAAVPRGRLVVRPVRHPRRHPERDDPRARRGVARRRDPCRRQLHVPGAGRAGPGAAVRAGRDQAVQRAALLHVRRLADAAAAAARGDGGLAGHRLHAGLRAHRGVRRRDSPAARGAPQRRGGGPPRAAALRRPRDPRLRAADRRPRHRSPTSRPATPARSGCGPRS